jgi:hypothetical protein
LASLLEVQETTGQVQQDRTVTQRGRKTKLPRR